MATHTKNLLTRALQNVPRPPAPNAPITLALSGGVDSSVAGLLLRERGWRVQPILMRCWADGDDDDDASAPCFDTERRAAEGAAQALGLSSPLVLDFVREYWNDVFDGVLLRGLRDGDTPNAELACNREVKFGALPRRLRELGRASRFATGHYARIREGRGGVELLRGRDFRKDQSYFLASVSGEALREAVFPVGGLLKSETREIAREAGLPAATARSSRGICFVGKRRMGEFLGRFLEGSCGEFVDVDDGARIGAVVGGAVAYTSGQRARIGGCEEAYYVVGRRGGDVVVAKGKGHAALWVSRVVCGKVEWVAGYAPRGVREGVWMACKTGSTREMRRCFVRADGEGEGVGVVVEFEQPVERVAAGQAVVLYDGEVCLGAAWPVREPVAFA